MSRPTYLEIDLTQLINNAQAIRQRVTPAKVCVMLKANAYGHGVEGVAPAIEPYVDMIGVAILEEGIQLRKLGIKKPILVAGGAFVDQIGEYIQHDLRITISSYEVLRAAEQIALELGKTCVAHLKIDTGMQRSGIRWYEAESFVLEAAKCKNIVIEGIYTHFANSELPRHSDPPPERPFSITEEQIQRFNEVLAIYPRHGLAVPPIRHAANSGAILNYPEAFFDMVRPGIMFYGIYPGAGSERTVLVKSAASWISRLAYVKSCRTGDPVSYGSLWAPEKDTTIGTIPCGYGDGYFRLLSGKSSVLVNGVRKSQVGRICMDQFVIDLGISAAKSGDEVILLGEDPHTKEEVSADELARIVGTNAYEIMTNISARVPRVFKK